MNYIMDGTLPEFGKLKGDADQKKAKNYTINLVKVGNIILHGHDIKVRTR